MSSGASEKKIRFSCDCGARLGMPRPQGRAAFDTNHAVSYSGNPKSVEKHISGTGSIRHKGLAPVAVSLIRKIDNKIL
jgi:hypothetical protein